ncbi:hypothetical protein [Propionibacterium cyclohexanicum]|uniref:hypothetical protein n=1 Tax=Propionibacterium cyclohexanicum TaxID=64702 RepID=UPI000B867931|nr:hypothetical protein [Propionibacterium cyclohexanicum]
MINQAQQADPQGLERKVTELRTSHALMALFAGAPNTDTQTYLEFFAAASSGRGCRVDLWWSILGSRATPRLR